ncbi:conjugative transposon protein TraN [Flavobacterium sp. MAHUQ-51]|uniref:conjugative transposon protein TraN n=1 Tax=Flavobacterium sp. GCM10022190 TaxID=3252639 RepID=UPI003619C6EA
MKRMNVVVIMITLFFMNNVFGQLQKEIKEPFSVNLDSLTIAYSKTTNIVFPYAILSVDRGSNDFLVQKAKGVENILQLKAAKEDFKETNLTVVTSDGQLYSFILNFDEENPVLNLVVASKNDEIKYLGATEAKNEEQLHSYAELAYYAKDKLYNVRDKKYWMEFRLDGVFIHEDVLYYRIQIENYSKIGYAINQLRFFIRDQNKMKRTASQELEICPLYIFNQSKTIEGKSANTLVFAFSKFTIPDKKHLVIQLMEEQGGRHFELQVKNRKLMQLAVLPILE